MILLLSCLHRHIEAPPPRLSIPVLGLRDVACTEKQCLVLTDSLLTLPELKPLSLSVAWADTLKAEGESFILEGNCEEGRCRQALDSSLQSLGDKSSLSLEPELVVENYAEAWIAAWNKGIEQQWRSGFGKLIVLPGPSTLSLLRGMDGVVSLISTKGAAARIQVGTVQPAFEGWLAMHPSGQEAYLCAWPSPLLMALDPFTLTRRWTLSLEGAAQGLFIEENGRFLVAATGDYEPELALGLELSMPRVDADGASDELLRAQLQRGTRPPISEVHVIDLADHSIVASIKGSYRRMLWFQEQLLLATNQELYFSGGF